MQTVRNSRRRAEACRFVGGEVAAVALSARRKMDPARQCS
jgi:hypothetical protein